MAFILFFYQIFKRQESLSYILYGKTEYINIEGDIVGFKQFEYDVDTSILILKYTQEYD